MKSNQRGFSAVEILIGIIVVGLLGAVGWLVYDRQNSMADDKLTTAQINQQEQNIDEALRQETLTTLVSSRGVSLATASLPTGWNSTEKCEEYTALILPPEKTSVKCGTEDFGFIALSIIQAGNTDAPNNCDGVEAKRTEYKQYDWFVSYDCELATVDGKQAVKETTVQNENAALIGASTYVIYTLRLSEETAVTASFTNIKDTGKPEYINTFNDFVKTLRLQVS